MGMVYAIIGIILSAMWAVGFIVGHQPMDSTFLILLGFCIIVAFGAAVDEYRQH